MAENIFNVEYAKGIAKCKKCKIKMPKGALRIVKTSPGTNFFGGDDTTAFYHPACIFESFKRARRTTRIIVTADDILNIYAIKDVDKDSIMALIKEYQPVLESRGRTRTKLTKKIESFE